VTRSQSIQVRGDRWSINGPLEFAGSFAPPGDKSIAHRAFLLATLSHGRCILRNVPGSEDVGRTRVALQDLGVRIASDGDTCTIWGVGLRGLRPAGHAIECGNSGTTMRLLLGVLAMQRFASELVGDESLSRRPMRRVAEPLRAMGARIVCQGAGDRPPLRIDPAANGRLTGIEHRLPVDSAQVRSAILLAALGAPGATTIRPRAAARDHTERMLRSLGVEVHSGPSGSTLTPGAAGWGAFAIDIPGDLSALAFFAARASAEAVEARAAGQNPGRLRYLEILRQAGLQVEVREERCELGEPVGALQVSGRARRPLRIAGDDSVRCIDEIPALLAAAVTAGVAAHVEDAGELRMKESDRISAMVELLRAFGAAVHETRDALRVEPRAQLRPATVHSRGDHRIAMAAAVLACGAAGTSVIDGIACVRTSYPHFADDFARLARPV
jgi:3-phosphoshikimate 1-carboxyvinyltransferase